MEEYLRQSTFLSPHESLSEEFKLLYARKLLHTREEIEGSLGNWQYIFHTHEQLRTFTRIQILSGIRKRVVDALKRDKIVIKSKLARYLSPMIRPWLSPPPRERKNVKRDEPPVIAKFPLPHSMQDPDQTPSILQDNPLQKLHNVEDEERGGLTDSLLHDWAIPVEEGKRRRLRGMKEKRSFLQRKKERQSFLPIPSELLETPVGLKFSLLKSEEPEKPVEEEGVLPTNISDELDLYKSETFVFHSLLPVVDAETMEKTVETMALIENLLRPLLVELQVDYGKIFVELYYLVLIEFLSRVRDLSSYFSVNSLHFLASFDYLLRPYTTTHLCQSVYLSHLQELVKLILACVSLEIPLSEVVSEKLIEEVFDIKGILSLEEYVRDTSELFLSSYEHFALRARERGIRLNTAHFVGLGKVLVDPTDVSCLFTDVLSARGLYAEIPRSFVMVEVHGLSLGITREELLRWKKEYDSGNVTLPSLSSEHIHEYGALFGVGIDIIGGYGDRCFLLASPEVVDLFNEDVKILNPIDVVQLTTDGERVEILRRVREELYMSPVNELFPTPIQSHGVLPAPCPLIPPVSFKLETLGMSCVPDVYRMMTGISVPDLGAGNKILVTLLLHEGDTCYVSIQLWERQFNITSADRIALMEFAHNLVRRLETIYILFD